MNGGGRDRKKLTYLLVGLTDDQKAVLNGWLALWTHCVIDRVFATIAGDFCLQCNFMYLHIDFTESIRLLHTD